MESEFSGMWIAGLFFILLGLGFLVTWAKDYGEMEIKKEAKERGYMQFTVNQTNGESKLTWK